MAVIMKFADVLMMETRTVEDARVRARVKRPHMMALKRRFMPKKVWHVLERRSRDFIRVRTARRAYSKNLFEGSRPNAAARELDQELVSSVVVLGYR